MNILNQVVERSASRPDSLAKMVILNVVKCAEQSNQTYYYYCALWIVVALFIFIQMCEPLLLPLLHCRKFSILQLFGEWVIRLRLQNRTMSLLFQFFLSCIFFIHDCSSVTQINVDCRPDPEEERRNLKLASLLSLHFFQYHFTIGL